jgi:hypothetical protein
MDRAWSFHAAGVLKAECWLHGKDLNRGLGWWKRLREKGVADGDIEAAIKGLPKIIRVAKPWPPWGLFKPDNHALFQEAMSAGRKSSERKPQTLKAIFARLGRE